MDIDIDRSVTPDDAPGICMTRLTIYFDYTDPWSYIALFRAQWLREQVPHLDVTWHPFEVFPDLPPRGARPQNPAFLRRKIQYDIDAMTRELGITIRVPYDRVTNSRLALAGGLLAHDRGCFDAYHHAIFAAFFEQWRDIGTLDTVVAVAAEVGIDAVSAREALEGTHYAHDVVRLRAEAEEYGVAAVPTFVANNQGAVGIVAKERLLRVVTTTSPPIERAQEGVDQH